mgnify:CR=1 FL=1
MVTMGLTFFLAMSHQQSSVKPRGRSLGKMPSSVPCRVPPPGRVRAVVMLTQVAADGADNHGAYHNDGLAKSGSVGANQGLDRGAAQIHSRDSTQSAYQNRRAGSTR